MIRYFVKCSSGTDWSEREVDLIVADYFDMLRLELLAQPYNKTEHRRKIRQQINDRSDGSVEFKHQNISSVLVNMGYPYINGYKPRGNYQKLLADRVEAFLVEHPDYFDHLADAQLLNPNSIPAFGNIFVNQLFESPPERIIIPESSNQPWISRRGRKTDFMRRDAENRRLGRLGEEFVVEVEKQRLLAAGRDDLADRVEWVAQTRGDGIGFDILSFDERDESERLVEVKTTGLGKFFPFYVSVTEVLCSEDTGQQYHLYRVFDFSISPRLYVLRGALSATCRLDPVQYCAVI
ncbi:MAG: DUF3883 domain-containing protein [Phycisphaerales bacterium]|nr:DUF3883 domain-containing protein [Phycisphaerales bacterium]